MNPYLYPAPQWTPAVDYGRMYYPGAAMQSSVDAAALSAAPLRPTVGRCPSCASVVPMVGQSTGGGLLANCNWTEIIVSGLVGAVIAVAVGKVIR